MQRRCWPGLKRVATRVTGEVFATGARVCEERPSAKRDTLLVRDRQHRSTEMLSKQFGRGREADLKEGLDSGLYSRV